MQPWGQLFISRGIIMAGTGFLLNQPSDLRQQFWYATILSTFVFSYSSGKLVQPNVTQFRDHKNTSPSAYHPFQA